VSAARWVRVCCSGPVIELTGLTKRYRARVAVDDLTVRVLPGRVTGFLGPNGSGKTTTMRCVLGLTRPTAGTATVLGRHYRELTQPMRTVGALIDPRARHPRRSARDHLLVLAQSNALPADRVEAVVELVGLESVAAQRVGGFSLGMGQRLGIAVALLGDPEVLLFDEPVNGLDPDGIRWVRGLLRGLSAEQTGDVAFAVAARVHELTRTTMSLESAYLALTGEDVEYRAGTR
jgi:ABC-2 type transport system ATP-binding protein